MKYSWLPLVLTLASATQAEKPNIIVFMADDMGYADAGFTGSRDILTPNLDKIAASGVVFTQGYANHSFCGPTRAALLTGRYQHRFGFETNPAYDPANPVMGIDPNEVLFPERLRRAGYVTGCVGKWHLGAAEPFHPNNRGFDYFYGFLGGGHDYFSIDLTKPVKEAYLQALVRNSRPADFQGYLTTALSRDAVSFVEANKDNPFFLYVAYNAPHTPLQAPEEDIALYAHIEDEKRRVYAAMVDVMDRGIGEVVTALEQHGLRENTLIFFLSDNGGPLPQKDKPWNSNGSSNKPFRGGKGNMYEGGVHVPFIASWPAKIEAGQTFEYPVISLDVSRTAVEVAAADATAQTTMEGVDLIPYLTRQAEGPPHDALFWRQGNRFNWAVLAADGMKHVLERQGNSSPQLFYLPDDVAEAKDILTEQPDRAAELQAMWKEWNANNVPCRLVDYIDYHRRRDKFFSEAIPGAALDAGYQPEVKEHFK